MQSIPEKAPLGQAENTGARFVPQDYLYTQERSPLEVVLPNRVAPEFGSTQILEIPLRLTIFRTKEISWLERKLLRSVGAATPNPFHAFGV